MFISYLETVPAVKKGTQQILQGGIALPAAKMLVLIFSFIMLSSPVELTFAQEKDPGIKLNDIEFLEGKWTAEGEGKPGQGNGAFTFSYDLNKNIFTRKSHTDIVSRDGKTVQAHDDLMIIYQLSDGQIKAIYFDNEGHVINYNASLSKDKKELTFLSDILQQVPRFRLVYSRISDDKLKVSFDIAPPGRPEAFSTYVDGISVKEK